MTRRLEVETAALAGALLGLYAWGACPTIYVGDSGELVAAAATLGIPHPSGYPLYVLLGKLWTLLVPLGSVAYRMSLFSAAAAALACGVLYGTGRRLGLERGAAAFGALLLAVSPSLWGEANVQRVYALNALFLALALAAAFAWHRSAGDARLLALAFFVCGVGATNHTVMAVVAVALTLAVVVRTPNLLRQPRPLALAGAAFVAGLLPYLYLPLRSRMEPRLDWGNPESLPAFLAVVTRRDFWHRRWFEGPADLVPITWDYLASLGPELSWAGTALAIVGVVAGWRRGWPVLFPLLVMAGNLLTMALHGSRSDLFLWHRYYVPSYLAAALLAACGAQAILGNRRRWLTALLIVPLLGVGLRFRSFDRSRYQIAEDFSRTLLSTLPPGAHLAASDDNILFVLIYLHLVEGLRPDVDLILQGVGDAELPPLRFNPDTDPLFFTHHPNWRIGALQVEPVGLVFRAVRAGTPAHEPVIPKTALIGEDDPRVPKDYLTSNLIGQFHYMLGLSLESRDWPRAARELDKAARTAADNDVLFYNLGLIYQRNGLLPESLAAFERSQAINPRALASLERALAADRVAELSAELAALDPAERAAAARAARDGLDAGTPAYHRAVAAALEAQGLARPARGHRLRAERLAAGGS